MTQRGYAQPEEAFMPITSIGVYLQWMDAMICLAVRQNTNMGTSKISDKMPEVYCLKKLKRKCYKRLLQVIEDADILSGWNSEGYDIPHTTNRIIKVLGKSETLNFVCGTKPPKKERMKHMVQKGKVMT